MVDKLIPLVMKLQDAFNAIDARNSIELSQIVVGGSQSTGKSSVLRSGQADVKVVDLQAAKGYDLPPWWARHLVYKRTEVVLIH